MIAILMATFNGAKYIREQIDSILSQTYPDWTLYVRDDGSTDETLSIVKEYVRLYTSIKIINDDNLHKGPGDSFMWLLNEVQADYYMFCDQDDVWLNNKLETSYERMMEEEKRSRYKPILVYSDAKIVDANLLEMSTSWYEYIGKKGQKNDNRYFLIGNLALGCTIMINEKAKKVMFPYETYSIMHDYWLALKVYANGGILAYIDSPLMLYRQHGKNALGAAKKVGIYSKILHFREYFRRFRECWIMSHRMTGVGLCYFLYLKIKSRFI